MIIGYARVSTTDQNPKLQVDALEKAGAEQVFQEKFTGTLNDHRERVVTNAPTIYRLQSENFMRLLGFEWSTPDAQTAR